MIEGCICLPAENKALTNFSPSPTYLEVRVDALGQSTFIFKCSTLFAQLG